MRNTAIISPSFSGLEKCSFWRKGSLYTVQIPGGEILWATDSRLIVEGNIKFLASFGSALKGDVSLYSWRLLKWMMICKLQPNIKKRHSPVLMAIGCCIQVKSITLRLLENDGIIVCNNLSCCILLIRFHVLRRA